MLVGIKNSWDQSQTKAWGLRAKGAWSFAKNCYENVIQATKNCWNSMKQRWSDTRAAFKERPWTTFALTVISPLRWVATIATSALVVTKDVGFVVVETACYVVEGAAAVVTDASDLLVAGVHKAAEKLTKEEKPAAVAA